MKHCYFIVRLRLDVEFEMNLEANATIWRSDIYTVNA